MKANIKPFLYTLAGLAISPPIWISGAILYGVLTEQVPRYETADLSPVPSLDSLSETYCPKMDE